MNFPFLLGLVLVFMVVWAIASYFLMRINQQTRVDKQAKSIQPAFRLADQWIMESQRKIEQFVESAESPLGTAQHELLELRLEAGRLPQGVKNLRTLRESLVGNIRPMVLEKSLTEIVALYLAPESYQAQESDFVYLTTDMGMVPVLEAHRSVALSDSEMKNWLHFLTKHANATMGGFLYFAGDANYTTFQKNNDWAEALRKHKLMALDFKGLTALLLSLKVVHETDQLLKVFAAGVESTKPLVGHSDRMGLALAALGASALNAQSVLDGGMPHPSTEVKE